MRCLILTLSMVLLFSVFNVYSIDNDFYLLKQEQLKHVADDCSAAAMLYYDKGYFAAGQKVFDQTAGNVAIEYILHYDLSEAPKEYFTYYFDQGGKKTVYRGKIFVGQEDISFPYTFEEALTGYTDLVTEPRVIVTVDMGEFDYRLKFLDNQNLIRTSGYEYVGY